MSQAAGGNAPAVPGRTAAADGTYAAYLARRRFGSLDGLRCLCIAAVLWHHSPLMDPNGPVQLLARGFVGVDMFFVLSGFLITTLLLREERATGRISLSAFYWRRALRILPAYLLLLTAMSVYWIGIKDRHELLPLVPYYLLFLANFLREQIPLMSVTWSLSVEEQFYLLWPGLFLLARQRALPLLLALLVLAPLARVVVWILFPGERVGIDEEFPFVADALAAGCVVALLCERVGGERLAAWMPGWGYVLAAGTTLLAASFSEWPSFHLPIGASLVNVGIAVVLLGIVHRPFVLLKRWLDSAPLIYIGGLSYSLYLWQQLFLDPDQPLANRSLLLAIGLAFLAAVASHRLVERPLLALRAHLRH